jgi:hypothetical protein
MIDVQVIEIRDILPVKNVYIAEGVDPPTLVLDGLDFNSAHRVFINNVEADEVVVVSSTKITVVVPFELVVNITSVTVVSNRLTSTERSKITFGLGEQPKGVQGIERLMQKFLKVMLQSPNRDIWSPKTGGGLLDLVGKTFGKGSEGVTAAASSTLAADMQVAVDRARRQLIAIQANSPQTSATERLLYARLLETQFLPHEMAIYGRIELASHAGQSAVVRLEV